MHESDQSAALIDAQRAVWSAPPNGSDEWSSFCQRFTRSVLDVAVEDQTVLNNAEPASSQTYGEIEPKAVSLLISTSNITSTSTFADLGSGIGNVVVQVALEAGCDASGWELMPNRAAHATRVLLLFSTLVSYFGLRAGSVQVYCQSFVDQAAADKWISCTHIFTNNFTFIPALMESMRELIKRCPDNTTLVSSKTLSDVHRDGGRTFTFNARNADKLGAILVMRAIKTTLDSVSWTGSPVTFFLSRVDRSALRQWKAAQGDGDALQEQWKAEQRDGDALRRGKAEQGDGDPLADRIRHLRCQDPCIEEHRLAAALAIGCGFVDVVRARRAVHDLCDALAAPRARTTSSQAGYPRFECKAPTKPQLLERLGKHPDFTTCPFYVALSCKRLREDLPNGHLVVRSAVLVHWCT